MINQYPNKDWNWYNISRNPGITMQDIIKYPEYPWKWNSVFGHSFSWDKSLYVNNQIGKLLLIAMLDDYYNDNSTLLINTLLVLYNDYHLSQILPYL